MFFRLIKNLSLDKIHTLPSPKTGASFFSKIVKLFQYFFIHLLNLFVMKKLRPFKTLSLLLGFLGATLTSFGQFGPNNLAVLVADTIANNTTVRVVEINKTAENQTAIHTIAIPGTGTNAIRVSGSATSTLYAANSADGSRLIFTGHLSETTTGNANTILPRAVVTLDHARNLNIATTYQGSSGNQTRCATTLNNTDFFIADQGGQFTNAAESASPAGNFRGMKTFGGVVYVGRASGTAGVAEVSTTSALTGGSITALPGIDNHANHQDFYLISSGSSGASFDVLYILRSTSHTAGTIAKFSLVGGTWVANGTHTTTYGGFGLAAERSGSGAALYLSTGLGNLGNNSVRRLTDAAGFNQNIDITGDIVLFTASDNRIVKGVAFAPKPLLPFDTYFHFGVVDGTRPSWMVEGGHTERGFTAFGDKVYVASRNAGTHVLVLDRLTGLQTGTLNTTGITGGFWVLNDIEVSGDGHRVGFNMWTSGGDFKAYLLNETAPAEVLFSANIEAGVRIGDKVTLVGRFDNGSAKIYAPSGTTQSIFVWSMMPSGNSWVFNPVPAVITLAGVTFAGTPVVAPLPDGSFYWTASGRNVTKHNADGSLIQTIPGIILATGTTAMKYLGKIGNDEILAVFAFGANNENARIVRVVDGDPTRAELIFASPTLRGAGGANPNGTGDMAFLPYPDGNFAFYVLATNVGIGGYKTKNLNVTFPVYPAPPPQIGWANLQWPATGNITPGQEFNVYGKVWIQGVTGGTTPATGLQAWVGYSTQDTNPDTWTNWIASSHQGPDGNNDEFVTNLGAAITAPGTYYYATRYKYLDQPFVYGGFNGGFWNGTSNVSGVLTVTAAPPPTFAVTFNVNMSAVSGFDPATHLVHIAGNFPAPNHWSTPGSNAALRLNRVGETLVWSITLNLPAGDVVYKFFSTHRAAGWNGGEWDGDPNRSASISQNVTLNHVWGVMHPTSIDDLAFDINTRVFPNPVRDVLTINSQQRIDNLRLLDMAGRQVFSTIVNGFETKVDVSKFNQGLYILQVQSGNRVNTHRIQVVR